MSVALKKWLSFFWRSVYIVYLKFNTKSSPISIVNFKQKTDSNFEDWIIAFKRNAGDHHQKQLLDEGDVVYLFPPNYSIALDQDRYLWKEVLSAEETTAYVLHWPGKNLEGIDFIRGTHLILAALLQWICEKQEIQSEIVCCKSYWYQHQFTKDVIPAQG